MSHHHSHHGNNIQETNRYGSAFTVGIGLNIIFIIVEIIYGLKSNSSALIADAVHNISDVLGLSFAWIAIWLANKKPKGRFSYGYKKSTILVSVLNALLLFIAVAFITEDAIKKFIHPENVSGSPIIIVATIGIIINGVTALLFMKDQKNDLNIKGAFLHMAADAAVSMGVVVAGIIIKYTGFVFIDPIISILIVVIIVVGTWRLFFDSVSLALDATPKDIDLRDVKNSILNHSEVENVHDLHVWALSTSENAISMHLITNTKDTNSLLTDIQELLSNKFHINHNTIQIETGNYSIECAKCQK